jgi:subtilisin-like proprotein convertase family protein
VRLLLPVIALSIATVTVLAQDTTPPETVIVSGPAEGATVTTSSVLFTVTATDLDDEGVPQSGTTCSYRLDPIESDFGSPVVCSTTPVAKLYSNLETGAYTFHVRAHDAAGNIDASAATRTFSVDLGPDPLLEEQWHLKSRSFEVAGTNVRNVWNAVKGSGVAVGVVDDGLQHTHPDLQRNYSAALSWDFNFNDPDPLPSVSAAHGTAVAGVAAARAGNGIGVSGTAPQATLAALRLLAAPASDLAEANAFAHEPQAVHVLSNSWGPSDDGATLDGPGPLAEAAMENAVRTGRNGRGRIFTFAAGNGRNGPSESDNCNFDGYANSRFVIAVGAVNDLTNQASYSESCSALLVSAPSSDTDAARRKITTTDLVGVNGASASDYTSTFGGTSAATPLVSGVVALMLESNPTLTWRDVKYILRETSSRSAIVDPAAGWTNGSLPHSERYGFGLIDAEAAVARAATWANVPPESAAPPVQQIVGAPIPDNTAFGATNAIALGAAYAGFTVEHVEVELTATHLRRGDLEVTLTSPSGVTSRLASPRQGDTQANFTAWRFRSVRHWGESAAGTWTLTVADRRPGTAGTFTSWTLRLFGKNRGYITGRVFGNNEPIENVDVRIYNSVGTLVTQAATDASGAYVVGGLATGNYRAQLVAPGQYLNQAYSGIDCLALCSVTTGQLISVTEGAERTGIDFTLTPRLTLTAVAPATGSELGGTLVMISGAGFTAPASVTFGGIAAQNVTVVSGTTMTAVAPAHALGPVNVVVTLGNGQTATLVGGFSYVAPPSLQITGLVFSPPSPVKEGTGVTVTAAAIGGKSPQYQFWRLDLKTKVWALVQDYSTSATYVWPAAQVVKGTYIFQVRGRSQGSPLPFDSYYQSGRFVVSAGNPARITKVTITPGAVVPYDTVVTLAASASGGSGTLEYEFWRANAAGGDWLVVKPYSQPGASYSWTPRLADVGSYVFEVRVRSQGSTEPMEAEYGNISLVVTANQPATLTGVSVSPASPAAAGTTVTLTAHGSGGVAPLQYQFWRYHEESGTWTLVQDYPGGAIYTWNTTAADVGTFIFHVRVRSSGSVVAYESLYQTGRFNVSDGPAPAQITSMIPRPSSPVVPGTAVVLQARASGGTNPLEYQFWRFDATSTAWTVIQDFSLNDSSTWTASAGAHLFQVRVRSAGSTAVDSIWTTPAWFIVTSGAAAKLTDVTGPASPVAAPATATWTAQASAGTDAVEYQFYRYHEQTGLWALVQDYAESNVYSWQTTAAEAGTYLFQVRARRAGSTLPFESVLQTGWYFISNGTPAVLTSFSSNTGASVQPGTQVTWTAAASGAPSREYQFRRINAATGEWVIVQEFGPSATYVWTPGVADVGTYKFQVRVRKSGASTYDHMLESSWFVVATGAVARLTGVTVPASPVNSGAQVTWTALATGGVAPLQYQFWRHHLESKTWSLERDYSNDNTFTWTTTANDVGTYVFQVRVRSVGSAVPFESLFESASVVIQPPPPETTIDSGPPASTLQTSATFAFSASESGVTFQCSLDAAAFLACVSPVTYTNLSIGAHAFAVRAIAASGSIDPTPASRTWIVVPPDTTPPQTTIDSGPPASTTSTTATFTFSASEAGSTFQCSLDSAPFGACVSPAVYTSLTVAAHTFAVRATDLSGNTDATPASYAWTILPPDTTPPSTTITSAPAATTVSTGATFEFSSNESGSSFECSLDGAAFAACTSPRVYSGLSDGAHTFAVRAIDAAGNTDPTPATHAWTIEAPSCGSPVTLSATADSWIDQSSPSNNNGSDSVLKVQGKSSANMRALVRFTLPPLTPGCSVQSATLTMFAASFTSGRTLNALRISGSWAESTVTWSTQPATAGTAATTTSGSDNRQWTVTAQVQEMYDAGQSQGFLIRDASETGGGFEQQFRSREAGETPPTLTVSFVAASTRSTAEPRSSEPDVVNATVAAPRRRQP